MKIIELDERESLYYCTRDEDSFFDRKSSSVDGRAIQKIVVAFANADGGEVVVGIDDEKEGFSAKDR